MRTEEEIIYTIWNTVRAGEISQDDSITERLLRNYLKSHRGKHLGIFYEKGMLVDDECFQNLGNITFTKERVEWVSPQMPKIIRLNNFGIAASKNGFPISLVNNEEFRTSENDRFNRHHPKIKFINNRLYLYLGLEQGSDSPLDQNTNSPLNLTVRQLNFESSSNEININVRAVLVDPDDALDYDFTSSPYPFPDELIDSLVNSVNARDFNLFLRTFSDKITDNKANASGQPEQREV